MIRGIKGKDLLMLSLFTPGITNRENEPIVGRTRLVKMMFLFENELKKDFLHGNDAVIFEFVPYLFGPYSIDVIKDLNFLIDLEFICEQETSIPISSAESVEQKKNVSEETKDDLWDEVELNTINERCEENYEMQYMLTDKGMQYVKEKIWSNLEDNQESILLRLKAQINRIPLDDLLNYVYHKYPKYTVNSTIKDKYL